MSLRLEELSAQQYAHHVLPLTQPLWGHGRTLEIYQEQTTRLAHTPYGRSSYRTVALTGDGAIVASFKRYERDARVAQQRLRGVGIGAVFTPETFRGRGFASAMLAMALDEARAAAVDFAFLFSDIHPQFYKDIGFIELASRSISVRADSLGFQRISAQPIGQRDWSAVRACFDAMERQRAFALVRTPAVWNWMRTRIEQHISRQDAQQVNLAVRKGGAIVAYVLGRREPRHDAYVVDEFAYAADSARTLIPALLRYAAGDLRRIAGWLPPEPARGVLPRGPVRKRGDAILMIAPLSAGGTRFVEAVRESSSADAAWSLDHI